MKLVTAILAARRQQLAETKASPGSVEATKSRDEILEKILDPELLSVPQERSTNTQLNDQ